MSSLEKSIIATISYFDIFDYPLTTMEIWKWLYVEDGVLSVDIMAVQGTLEKSEYLRQRLATQDGFYFLQGRAGIVQTRHTRYSLAEQKYHKAKKVIRFLRWLPFVRMISVCSSLSYSNSRADGDIDLMIVAAKGRIWQTRFWVTGFLELTGLRPDRDSTRDKVCSSYFIDEDHLDVSTLSRGRDIHLLYLVMQVIPLYDEGIYASYFEANGWARRHLPNLFPVQPTFRRQIARAGFFKKILCACCAVIPDGCFRWFQMMIMPVKLRLMANQDTRVIINDHMLKFHDNDRRQFFLERWQQRLQEVL